MKEAHMLDAVQDALARAGIEDELVAAGLFFPGATAVARSSAG